MVLYRCHCLNVSLSVISRATPVQRPEDLGCDVNIQKYGVAELALKPAVVHSELEETRADSGWRISRCLNCLMDCYVAKDSMPSRVYINMSLIDGDSANRIRQDGDFSPAFFIVVRGDLDSADSVNPTKLFQREVDEFLERERNVMQARVIAFINSQKEAFQSLQARAQRDQTVLTRKVFIHRDSASERSLQHRQSSPRTANSASASGALSSSLSSSFRKYGSSLSSSQRVTSSIGYSIPSPKGAVDQLELQVRPIPEEEDPSGRTLQPTSSGVGVFTFDEPALSQSAPLTARSIGVSSLEVDAVIEEDVEEEEEEAAGAGAQETKSDAMANTTTPSVAGPGPSDQSSATSDRMKISGGRVSANNPPESTVYYGSSVPIAIPRSLSQWAAEDDARDLDDGALEKKFFSSNRETWQPDVFQSPPNNIIAGSINRRRVSISMI